MDTDIRVSASELFFLPVTTRVPLKFGGETLTSITCARVRMKVKRINGKEAEGWGETPLSVQWVWPSALPYEERHDALCDFCRCIARAWQDYPSQGHAIEIGHDFIEGELLRLLHGFNEQRAEGDAMPWLAALVCAAAFDLALHDAYGVANEVPTYETYRAPWMNRDLSCYIEPAVDRGDLTFSGKFPADYLLPQRRDELMAWHLVGGLDAIDETDLSGDEPNDGHPVTLVEWIRRDDLKALKIKLRGNDLEWDYQRLLRVGRLALEWKLLWLTTDFNCMVTEPSYVTDVLDRLRDQEPGIYAMILYVEQPFPYELEEHPIPVHAVASRKPLFLDESAHDWRNIRRGRELGWNGVALKTCKTQTGALLSLCWAQAHGMTLMVQDLTNPMLAQVPHCLLAAHSPTIAGFETNATQFYPMASEAEAMIHPGLYQRRNGIIDLRSVSGPGFGLRVDEIQRHLPHGEDI